MHRSPAIASGAQRVAQLLRTREPFFVTPLGALSLVLLVPVLILYG